jgi:hypothetical protein
MGSEAKGCLVLCEAPHRRRGGGGRCVDVVETTSAMAHWRVKDASMMLILGRRGPPTLRSPQRSQQCYKKEVVSDPGLELSSTSQAAVVAALDPLDPRFHYGRSRIPLVPNASPSA